MFRVKICGVTRPDDALAAVESGADAIGLNFYEKSPRSTNVEQAAEVARAVNGGALLVGVFVNASAERIAEVVAAVPLGAIQLHGDEPPAFVAELPEGVPVIRAMRMMDDGFSPALRHLVEAEAKNRPLAAVLADAPPAESGPEAYGGTGRRADWPRFAAERPKLGDTPAILAGGLTPENVAEAVAAARPDGVDTASGVEVSPGLKDAALVRRFVEAARAALGGR